MRRCNVWPSLYPHVRKPVKLVLLWHNFKTKSIPIQHRCSNESAAFVRPYATSKRTRSGESRSLRLQRRQWLWMWYWDTTMNAKFMEFQVKKQNGTATESCITITTKYLKKDTHYNTTPRTLYGKSFPQRHGRHDTTLRLNCGEHMENSVVYDTRLLWLGAGFAPDFWCPSVSGC